MQYRGGGAGLRWNTRNQHQRCRWSGVKVVVTWPYRSGSNTGSSSSSNSSSSSSSNSSSTIVGTTVCLASS